MMTLRARSGAKYILALAVAGLMHSTPGLALIPQEFASEIGAIEAQPLPQVPAIGRIVPTGTVADVPAESPSKHIGDGEASYYGRELAGNRTASGERFNPNGLTAAHRSLPLGSKIRVTNKANGKSVVVRINDRGPFVRHRLIDVSFGAAQQIQMVRAGKAMVRLELLS